MYSDALLFLLDDPLSALDVHVGELCWTACSARAASSRAAPPHASSSRTRSNTSRIVVFMANGEIAETGSHDEL